jgi:hypothetical protein
MPLTAGCLLTAAIVRSNPKYTAAATVGIRSWKTAPRAAVPAPPSKAFFPRSPLATDCRMRTGGVPRWP